MRTIENVPVAHSSRELKPLSDNFTEYRLSGDTRGGYGCPSKINIIPSGHENGRFVNEEEVFLTNSWQMPTSDSGVSKHFEF